MSILAAGLEQPPANGQHTQQNNVRRTLEERLQITRITLADNVPRTLEWKVF